MHNATTSVILFSPHKRPLQCLLSFFASSLRPKSIQNSAQCTQVLSLRTRFPDLIHNRKTALCRTHETCSNRVSRRTLVSICPTHHSNAQREHLRGRLPPVSERLSAGQWCRKRGLEGGESERVREIKTPLSAPRLFSFPLQQRNNQATSNKQTTNFLRTPPPP